MVTIGKAGAGRAAAEDDADKAEHLATNKSEWVAYTHEQTVPEGSWIASGDGTSNSALRRRQCPCRETGVGVIGRD